MTSSLKKLKETGRDRLIAASLKLFSNKGFHACSIREICEAAKANISLVSFHFGGKEGLLDVIFEELTAADFAKLESLLTPVTSKEEMKIRLRIFFENYIDFAIKHGDVISLYLDELEKGNPQALERLPQTFEKTWKAINHFLQDAQDQKLISEEVNIEILSYQIMAPINHLLRTRFTSKQITLFSLSNEEFRQKLLGQIIYFI
jgi:AcrR family transcriptional regulator